MVQFLRLLTRADVLVHHKANTFLINPPKGANNQWWAEQTYKNAVELGFPALIVRPEQNAQELSTGVPAHRVTDTDRADTNSYKRGERFEDEGEQERRTR
jgi:hypothetical protein